LTATLAVLLALLPSVGGGLQAPVVAPAPAQRVQLNIDSGGRFAVVLQTDLDALLLGVAPATSLIERVREMEAQSSSELDRGVERLNRMLERRLRVRFDGDPVPFSIAYPLARRRDGRLLSLGNTLRLEGEAPDDARSVSFFASRSFGSILLTLDIEARRHPEVILLQPGERSAPVALDPS
jgi:hypothetical protein